MYIGFMKGCTAYELQIGRFYLRFIHLQGEHWEWKPWRRLDIWWLDKQEDLDLGS